MFLCSFFRKYRVAERSQRGSGFLWSAKAILRSTKWFVEFPDSTKNEKAKHALKLKM